MESQATTLYKSFYFPKDILVEVKSKRTLDESNKHTPRILTKV